MVLRLKVGLERIYRADINWVAETPFVLRLQSHSKSADQPMSFRPMSGLIHLNYPSISSRLANYSQVTRLSLSSANSFLVSPWSNAHPIIQHAIKEKALSYWNQPTHYRYARVNLATLNEDHRTEIKRRELDSRLAFESGQRRWVSTIS